MKLIMLFLTVSTTVAALIQNTIYAAVQQKGVAYEFETV